MLRYVSLQSTMVVSIYQSRNKKETVYVSTNLGSLASPWKAVCSRCLTLQVSAYVRWNGSLSLLLRLQKYSLLISTWRQCAVKFDIREWCIVCLFVYQQS